MDEWANIQLMQGVEIKKHIRSAMGGSQELLAAGWKRITKRKTLLGVTTFGGQHILCKIIPHIKKNNIAVHMRCVISMLINQNIKNIQSILLRRRKF